MTVKFSSGLTQVKVTGSVPGPGGGPFEGWFIADNTAPETIINPKQFPKVDFQNAGEAFGLPKSKLKIKMKFGVTGADGVEKEVECEMPVQLGPYNLLGLDQLASTGSMLVVDAGREQAKLRPTSGQPIKPPAGQSFENGMLYIKGGVYDCKGEVYKLDKIGVDLAANESTIGWVTWARLEPCHKTGKQIGVPGGTQAPEEVDKMYGVKMVVYVPDDNGDMKEYVCESPVQKSKGGAYLGTDQMGVMGLVLYIDPGPASPPEGGGVTPGYPHAGGGLFPRGHEPGGTPPSPPASAPGKEPPSAPPTAAPGNGPPPSPPTSTAGGEPSPAVPTSPGMDAMLRPVLDTSKTSLGAMRANERPDGRSA